MARYVTLQEACMTALSFKPKQKRPASSQRVSRGAICSSEEQPSLSLKGAQAWHLGAVSVGTRESLLQLPMSDMMAWEQRSENGCWHGGAKA